MALMPQQALPRPGWYPDSTSSVPLLRFWDGARWTSQTRLVDRDPGPGGEKPAPRKKRWWQVVKWGGRRRLRARGGRRRHRAREGAAGLQREHQGEFVFAGKGEQCVPKAELAKAQASLNDELAAPKAEAAAAPVPSTTPALNAGGAARGPDVGDAGPRGPPPVAVRDGGGRRRRRGLGLGGGQLVVQARLGLGELRLGHALLALAREDELALVFTLQTCCPLASAMPTTAAASTNAPTAPTLDDLPPPLLAWRRFLAAGTRVTVDQPGLGRPARSVPETEQRHARHRVRIPARSR